MVDKCPVCEKSNCIPEIAYDHTSAYGNAHHNVACVHCKTPLKVNMLRTVYVRSIRKAAFAEDDWATDCVI